MDLFWSDGVKDAVFVMIITHKGGVTDSTPIWLIEKDQLRKVASCSWSINWQLNKHEFFTVQGVSYLYRFNYISFMFWLLSYPNKRTRLYIHDCTSIVTIQPNWLKIFGLINQNHCILIGRNNQIVQFPIIHEKTFCLFLFVFEWIETVFSL